MKTKVFLKYFARGCNPLKDSTAVSEKELAFYVQSKLQSEK